MDEKEFISLHDSGDRTIIVGEKEDGQRLYKVSSVALMLASPVWRAMLNPASGFLESNANVPLEFPDDDPDALLLLLRIAHLRFQDLPNSISFPWLVQLAVLCDKYDTVSLVNPFIENWMRPWSSLALEPSYEKWLFISWTFGIEKIFNVLITSLVYSIEVDSAGVCLNSGHKVLDEDMPSQIIEIILELRVKTIAKLLKIFQDAMDSLIAGTYCVSPNHPSKQACNFMNMGSLVKLLHPLGLGAQMVPATEIKISISNIIDRLNNFTYLGIARNGGSPLAGTWVQGWYMCHIGRKLRPEINKVLEDIPVALQEHHRKHLMERGKKSKVGHMSVAGQETEFKMVSFEKWVDNNIHNHWSFSFC